MDNLKEDPTMWCLAHLPVINEDKAATKMRIVFNPAARTYGICLNLSDAIRQDPKLKRNFCAVLKRIRKYQVTLVCDVAEMYLRIRLASQKRKCHRFVRKKYESNKKCWRISIQQVSSN